MMVNISRLVSSVHEGGQGCDLDLVCAITIVKNQQQHFIIEDLDDYHLLIKSEEEDRIRRMLETELEKNTYSLDA